MESSGSLRDGRNDGERDGETITVLSGGKMGRESRQTCRIWVLSL